MRFSEIRIGVAGWGFSDWKGILYPAPRPHDFDPVRFLAGYIDVIEINSTFYAPPKAAVAKKWAERIQDLDDFRFTAKLWRRFTHERAQAWTRSDVRDVR